MSHRIFRHACAIALCAPVAFNSADAENDTSAAGDSSLDEVVVVANRAPEPLSKVGNSVTVLTDAAIRASQLPMVSDLLAQTRVQRAAIGVMHPGRVDVIGAGALVLDRIMQRFGFSEVLVSEHDILDGIAWSLAGSHPAEQ